ncbi:MAG: cytochrome c biogenesis protein DipZ [Solirubrobacteraceae bacterium]|nr:cytochrome c biogenesis protein DipZ [Patulibacter sp.]
MLLLLVFALLAGGGTALSPCVLPVLPALLSAGATGGRRRPLGIVLGLAITFTITIVGLAEVVDGVGLGDDVLRDLAIVVLLAFGLALVVPALADRLERPLLALSRLGPKTAGSGFATGLLVGGALGFVYAPCAGPILAAVVTVSAASGNTVAIAIAYALGSAIVLLLLSLGGRRVMDRVRKAGRGPVVQRALGGILVLTAACMIAGLDIDLETAIAKHAPDVSLTASLENSGAVKSRLRTITGGPKFDSATATASTTPAASTPGKASGFPVLGTAPDFVGTQKWFNTPGGKPLTLAGLRGKVVLIDFWTYSCINCLRTLPYLKAWNAEYAKDGLVIVGVHSPEFAFEKSAANVAKAIRSNGITYPVVQDNDLDTWNAWGNQYWPADYFVDAKGKVRVTAFGEGNYAESEDAIRKLLTEAGHPPSAEKAKPTGVVTPSSEATPETYLGPERAQGWRVPPTVGVHQYGDQTKTALGSNGFAYGGQWRIASMSATAMANATIEADVQAKNVYLVLGKGAGSTGRVRVSTDGRLTKTLTVTDHKLYTLASFPTDSHHRLSIRLDPGVTGYAFTFG